MSKFKPRISYLGTLRDNLYEPLYMYLGYLIVNCDKEKDCFEKLGIVLDNFNKMNDIAIEYLIKLVLFYIKCRINSSDVNVTRQLESVFKHYSKRSITEFSIKDEVDSFIVSVSKLDTDGFNDLLRELLSKVFKHFDCSLDENKDFKSLYDKINIDSERTSVSYSESNGLFGDDKIYFFDNQFLIDIDIGLGAPYLNSYDELKSDVIKNILMHIGYLYLNPKESSNDDDYLNLGELLENIDEVVKIYLIKLVNLYISYKVLVRKSSSSYLSYNMQVIGRILESYGFDITSIDDDIKQVCGEFSETGDWKMIDVHCQSVLEKVFSHFGYECEVPKIEDIANLYRELGFDFTNVTDLYEENGVSNVDMVSKIPYISPEKYKVRYIDCYCVPKFLSTDQITYLQLARNRGLTDEEITEKREQLAGMLAYYDAGVYSFYGDIFSFIWYSGLGIFGEKHGINILSFVHNKFLQFCSLKMSSGNQLKKIKKET